MSALGIGRRGALMGLAALAGCQAQPQPTVLPENATPRLSASGTGYVNLQAPITNQVRDFFIRDVNRLLDQNASEVYVLLSSPGGVVTAALDMIAFIERTNARRGTRFVMHNTGAVASAACYVFLAGQRRLSVPRGAFLFHEAAVISSGPITSQNLQEVSAGMQRLERSLLTMLTARTRLTEAEASSFVRRTVILSTDEARRDGIIEEIANVTLPQGVTLYQIRAVPNTPTPVRRVEQPGG